MTFLGQEAVRKKLFKQASGSTQINVGKPAILNIDVFEPPTELQHQFESFVAQVDKSKFAVQKALDEAQLLFDSLMQKYFVWGEKMVELLDFSLKLKKEVAEKDNMISEMGSKIAELEKMLAMK